MIKELIFRLFIHNWQRKTVAFMAAIAIWFLVDRSIVSEKEGIKEAGQTVEPLIEQAQDEANIAPNEEVI